MNTADIVRTVRCPWCKASAGQPCRVGRATKTGFVHPARRDAAAVVPVAPAPVERDARIIPFPTRGRTA